MLCLTPDMITVPMQSEAFLMKTGNRTHALTFMTAVVMLLAVCLTPALTARALAQPAVGVQQPDRNPSSKPAALRTAHYEIICEDGPQMAQLIGQYMEQLFAAYAQRIGRVAKPPRNMPRLKVYIASTSDSFAKLVGEGLGNSAGLYDSGRQRIVARNDGPLDRTLRVLRHEGCHQFINQYINPRMPIWIDEGLAVFFEEADLCGNSLQFGAVPTARVELLRKALADDNLHSMQEILGMDNEQWIAALRSDVQRSRLLYCEVWSIVHLLVLADDGKYRPALDRYLALLARKADPAEARRAAFGDVAAFNEKWRQYIKVMKPSPDALCRNNMKIIAELLPLVWNQLPERPSADQFRQFLLDRPRGSVTLAHPQLGRFSTGDAQATANLMRCPGNADGAEDRQSDYSFEYSTESGGDTSLTAKSDIAAALPQIICRHHGKMQHRLIFAYDARVQKIRYEIRLEPVRPQNKRKANY